MLPHRPAWLPPDGALRRFYGDTVAYPYYKVRLTEYVARLLPESGPLSLIDVGAGDGYLGSLLRAHRPHTRVIGVETAIRAGPRGHIPMVRFDGRRLPFADATFDAALLSNVLHHADDQPALLGEVCRVTRDRVIIKDHLARSALDRWRLAVLDVLGNWRFGAGTRGHYLGDRGWSEMFARVPGASVTRYDALSFRTGALKLLFPDALEVIFLLALRAERAPATRLST
jgi:SAM-dependent methyltransferase